ncbi:MAG TPA: KpsF/GutQ family sugar-phosphate isomerase [Candidatus Kapabacteria bacterium]|nr:KpsF/GutQ family sugar-phosphate isomerase [Candidatus Kapabacteria bacterium]
MSPKASEELNVLARGRRVIDAERDALERVGRLLDTSFKEAVDLLVDCPGKVIVTGVGKSGIIAQKITATLNSTGTPAFYLHPADALHGDLGMVRGDDVVIVLSKSGDTMELSLLLPSLRRAGVAIIAITGNPDSALARSATVVIDCSVEREACPLDLAPTASTTAMLALGDALAVVLYESKGFTREDFALTHPGGMLGRRLLLRVEDIMKRGDDLPIVAPDAAFHDVILEISRKRLGCALVAEEGRLLGIVTDGDLRRLLERRGDIFALSAGEMMTADPMSASPDTLGTTALVMLESKKRTQLPIVGDDGALLGIIHLHDLIEQGLRP